MKQRHLHTIPLEPLQELLTRAKEENLTPTAFTMKVERNGDVTGIMLTCTDPVALLTKELTNAKQ